MLFSGCPSQRALGTHHQHHKCALVCSSTAGQGRQQGSSSIEDAPAPASSTPRSLLVRRQRARLAAAMTNIQEVEEQLRAEALAPQRQLTVVPAAYTKTIHFIRHGEGFHNVAGRRDHDEYKNPAYLDAHLTEEGWRQAKAVHAHIKAAGIKVDVVLVSPLTRALETAVGCFGNHSAPLNGTPPLMVELSADPGRRAAHPAVSAEGCPPFVAYELCREHLGVHPCDQRHSLDAKQAMFPGVDFSLISEPHDVLWTAHHRETREEIQARGRAFMDQLLARPEQHIAVVSHSSFLHFMMTNYGNCGAPLIAGELHRWYENCELRSVVVVDAHASVKARDPLHFPGFASAVHEGPQV